MLEFLGLDFGALVVIATVVVIVPWGKVGQAARIWSRRLGGDPAVKALAAEQAEYDRLVELLPKQQESVERVVDTAVKAKTELEARQKTVADLVQRYNEAKGRNAGEEELNDLSHKYGVAKRAVTRQEQVLVQAEQAATDVRAILEQTIEATTALGQKLDLHKVTHELSKALEISAKAKEMLLGIGTSGDAANEIAKKLEEARARSELAKGTTKVEDELKELDEKAKEALNRAELEALATTTQG
jgi:hypothetical protein